MPAFNRKTQMMDAGTAVFSWSGGIGSAIGIAKAQLAEIGRVYTVSADASGAFGQDIVSPESLPLTCGDCDFFVDYSSIWRKRYISAKVEACSREQEYVLVLQEGNSSSTLRAVFYVCILLLCLMAVLFSHFIPLPSVLVTIMALVIAGAAAFLWISPDKASIKAVKQLIDSLV